MNKGNTSCFLDFDHTLFNTDLFFHVDVRAITEEMGIDEHTWFASYEKVLPTGYTLEKHVAAACDMQRINFFLHKMQRVLRERFSKLDAYVYADVAEFLTLASLRKWHVFLLSFGNASWQRYKVCATGLKPHFEKMFFTSTEGSKVDRILEMQDRFTRMILIDNNPVELDAVKDQIPRVQTFCINRVPVSAEKPTDELTKRQFLEARKYLSRPQRHKHHSCRSLQEVSRIC